MQVTNNYQGSQHFGATKFDITGASKSTAKSVQEALRSLGSHSRTGSGKIVVTDTTARKESDLRKLLTNLGIPSEHIADELLGAQPQVYKRFMELA